MNKKIQQIKELINAPQMPKIAKGLYKRVEHTTKYKHKDKGVEIELNELLESTRQLPHLRSTVVRENDELPWYVLVENCPKGWKREDSITWQETKTFDNEIVTVNKTTCDNISNTFE